MLGSKEMRSRSLLGLGLPVSRRRIGGSREVEGRSCITGAGLSGLGATMGPRRSLDDPSLESVGSVPVNSALNYRI